MFEFLRKFSLFMLLFVVGLSTYLSALNATDWKETLWVALYPIDGDGSPATREYIATLSDEDFKGIETFIQREAVRYSIAIDKPARMMLGPAIDSRPPEPPFGASFLRIGAWSLELRWWTYAATRGHEGPAPDIKLFLVFYDPDENPMLEHSVGLQKGRVGIVNVYANGTYEQTNNFVIAHEMLHTLGASDKYGPPDMLPVFPGGYAEPDKTPRYPQTMAELMGGRIALSATEAKMPASLKETMIGPESALEIRWIQ